MENFKTFVKKSLEYFIQRNKINRLNLEEHVAIAKSVNDIRIKNDEYLHAVLDRFSNDNSIFTREMYLTCAQVGL
jgi:hypothetical protein